MELLRRFKGLFSGKNPRAPVPIPPNKTEETTHNIYIEDTEKTIPYKIYKVNVEWDDELFRWTGISGLKVKKGALIKAYYESIPGKGNLLSISGFKNKGDSDWTNLGKSINIIINNDITLLSDDEVKKIPLTPTSTLPRECTSSKIYKVKYLLSNGYNNFEKDALIEAIYFQDRSGHKPYLLIINKFKNPNEEEWTTPETGIGVFIHLTDIELATTPKYENINNTSCVPVPANRPKSAGGAKRRTVKHYKKTRKSRKRV